MTVNLSDYSVKIEGVSYSMIEIPAPDSALVMNERAQVLHNLDLAKLVSDLELCKDLMFVAYNGVAGFGELTGEMSKFHHAFTNLCKDCSLQLDTIQRQSQSILGKLQMTFKLLLKGEEKAALKFLSGCSAIAEALASGSSELAKRFEGLSDNATAILAKTQTVQGQQRDEQLALEQKVKELNALTAEAQALIKGIAEQKHKLERLYDEAKEKAEKAEGRAFALAIVSAIFKPIAAGIGAFGAVYAGGAAGAASKKLAGAAPDLPVRKAKPSKAAAEGVKDTKQQELEAAKRAADSATLALSLAQRAHRDLDTQLEQAFAEEDDAVYEEFRGGETPEVKAALLRARAAVKAAKGKVDLAKQDLAAKQASEAEAKAALERIAAAFQAAAQVVEQTGEALGEVGEEYAQIAAKYADEKQQYLRMLMEKQDKETEMLAKIQGYAVQMQHKGEQIQTVSLTCESLHQAVGALKQVAVVLQDASMFWEGMAAGCRNLASASLESTLTGLSDLPKDLRIEMYCDDDVKTQVVRYYAGWKAIESIAKEYSAATNDVRAAANRDFVQNPKVEDARRLAIELGRKLANRATGAIARSETTRKELKAELDQLEKAS